MFHDDAIAGSWPALVRRIHRWDALGRWAADDPRLTHVRDVDRDLLPLLSRDGDRGRADEVLGALVRQAASDGGTDDDALLLVIHLMSEWVALVASELQDLGPAMVPVIVSELTCQIRTFPWRTRHRGVACSLRWDTRRAVLREFRPSSPGHRHGAEQVMDPRSAEWLNTPLGQSLPSPQDEAPIDVVKILDWATKSGAVTAEDVAFLIRVEQSRASASVREADDEVAAEFGLSRRTFFRRRAQVLNAVRLASRDYLEQAA